MKKNENIEKMIFLKQNEIPEDSIPAILGGALYFQRMKGLSLNQYWENAEFSNRDELFVILNSYFSLIHCISKYPPNNDYRGKFEVACLFQLKLTSQAILSLDCLTKSFCYTDCYSICRTMISRLNFLLLCALNPNLFDCWLKNQKDEIFLDGHVRKELKNNGISTAPHFYEYTSEIIHSHFNSLTEIGYFEHGLFPENKYTENEIYVLAKFIIAMTYQTILSIALQDFDGKTIPTEFKQHDALFDWFKISYLAHNRVDQFLTFMAQDRHIEKIGKDKYIIGETFAFDEIRIQIGKFHRNGQKKHLSKKYNC